MADNLHRIKNSKGNKKDFPCIEHVESLFLDLSADFDKEVLF